LTGCTKQLRHDLNAALAPVRARDRIAARDTTGDVGTRICAESEPRRDDPQDVLGAAFSRLFQSLRSLEEYGKCIDPVVGAGIEPLRYRAYTLQGAMMRTADSCERLGDALLYVLIDGRESADSCVSWARMLVEAGVDIIQLRDKRLTDRALFERAAALASVTRRSASLLIVNDRPDIAAAAGADGVHVGQDDLPAGAARRIVGPERLVGVSTHSIEQAREAVLGGADYIGVGPTFPSATKQFDAHPGLELIREVYSEIGLPAFAIGGIDCDNVALVTAAGADRVAVGAAITGAADAPRAAVALRRALAAGDDRLVPAPSIGPAKG
jgi:thiamine-phosphate pyrophosphorylase